MDWLRYEVCNFGEKLDGKAKEGRHGAAVEL
jgi:hypothetical protein